VTEPRSKDAYEHGKEWRRVPKGEDEDEKELVQGSRAESAIHWRLAIFVPNLGIRGRYAAFHSPGVVPSHS
jgi:hypothetical protein